jgi:hypothetical protein
MRTEIDDPRESAKGEFMKNLIRMAIISGLLMLVAIPVIASDTDDLNYINSVQSEYMVKIVDQGQTMIFDEVRLLEKRSPYSFPLTVGTGDYEIWGIGGEGIVDLEIRIYSANGNLLSEDSQRGKYPVLSFSETISRSHRVEVECSEFESGVSQDYYLIIVVKND